MRNRYLLFTDILVVALAAWGAFALRFDWFFMRSRPEFLPFLAAAVLLKPVCFFWAGIYRRYWRYASIDDLMALCLASAISTITLAVLIGGGMMARVIAEFSRSVVLIDGGLTLLLTGGVRLAVRVFGESRDRRRVGMRASGRWVIVIGAGNAGVMVVREMQRNPHLGMIPVGFLDDDPAKAGKWIHGVCVLGPIHALAAMVSERRATEAVIAMPTAPGQKLRAIANACVETGITYRTVPGMFELVDGKVGVSRLRHVEISDLLQRDPILGPADQSEFVAGRRVLVTGAGGSIGSELCRQLLRGSPGHLVLLGHGENSLFEAELQLRSLYPAVRITTVVADIRDAARIDAVFRAYMPHAVFHAAAHKHVPLMQQNPTEAVLNNVLGTQVIVHAALRHKVEQLVMISTDKAVSPSSVMGATKRIAEGMVRRAGFDHGRAFVVVRFGNVLGSRGSVVPVFKQQIEAGGPLTITHPDVRRFFMTIPEAVLLILRAAALGRGGELFVLEMGEPIRIVDLARDLMTLSAANPDDIQIVYTGLRPGEKLEEALWEEDAVVTQTIDPKILEVDEGMLWQQAQLVELIENLIGHATSGDALEVEATLTRAIPTYVPAAAMNV